MNKATETKYYDIADENRQIYHNVGESGGVALPTTIYGNANFFNCWADIPPGTGRANRVGDKIMPLSMTMKLWIASKADRPNVMFRVIIAKMPKSIGNTTTNSSNVYLFQTAQLGATGNTMVMPVDHDKGIKPYYDRTFNILGQHPASFDGSITAAKKEKHILKRIKIKRKRASAIIYDSATQNIVNAPLALFVIPYDSYGTVVTDNIASFSFQMRMYYKDS
jgi:hypothetical protein